MAKVLVSLVSEQTIPNFLFIKTFADSDMFVFVTTDRMENPQFGNKREWIIKASNIPESKQDKILVDAEIKENVTEKLSNYKWEQYDDIIVNITGGTKMMSIATYEFFKQKTSQIWYLPIGKREYHLCDNSIIKKEISHQMTVEEYLDCCGIFKTDKRYSEKSTFKDEVFVNEFYIKFIASENKQFLDNIELIRLLFRDNDAPRTFKNQLSKKGKINLKNEEYFDILIDYINRMQQKDRFSINLVEIKNFNFVYDFFSSINLPIENHVLSKDALDFITGGWFEEYTYYTFKSLIKVPITNFKLGVMLNPKPSDKERAKYFTDNDLDVVFVYNNEFYVVECKSAGMESSDLYNKTVYLASALRKYFGLSVKSVLCTMSEMNEDKKEKAETLGITAIANDVFIREDFKELIAKKLNFTKK